MKARIDYQTIDFQGHPAFVLVPWEEFKRIRPLLDGGKIRSAGIPQSVVEAHILRSIPMIRAWREHIGVTQKELAARMRVSQAAVAKWERPGARPRRITLEKIAEALELSVDMLDI